MEASAEVWAGEAAGGVDRSVVGEAVEEAERAASAKLRCVERVEGRRSEARDEEESRCRPGKAAAMRKEVRDAFSARATNGRRMRAGNMMDGCS